jgi:hypothetical protein
MLFVDRTNIDFEKGQRPFRASCQSRRNGIRIRLKKSATIRGLSLALGYNVPNIYPLYLLSTIHRGLLLVLEAAVALWSRREDGHSSSIIILSVILY